MSEDGYTLTETLVALAMMSMAVSGLALAVQVIGEWQSRTGEISADVQAVRAAQTALERLLDANGPFRSDKAGELAGDSQSFRLACGGPAECVVALAETNGRVQMQLTDGDGRVRRFPLRRPAPARFAYDGGAGELDAWPPEGERQVLRSISLAAVGTGAGPVLAARVWREQPEACAFDVVSQDCR